MTCKVTILPILFAAAYSTQAGGEAPPATLKVEIQNLLFYEVDTSDTATYGTNPNITPSTLSCRGPGFLGHLGNSIVGLGDIVAVNGQPAKGTYAVSGVTHCLSPNPVPGQLIADTAHGPALYETYQILQVDGTPVETVMTNGVRVSAPSPPGLPAGTFNSAIVSGTNSRSITEDPGNRRLNGGLHAVFTLYVIPWARPEKTMTASGPAVNHSNSFSQVNRPKPPGAVDVYQMNFRVPRTRGKAPQLSS